MTDLTVLVSPIPIYPESNEFIFGGRSLRPLTPIMVTLESEIDEEADQEEISQFNYEDPPPIPNRRVRTPTTVDSNLLSPPVNTWRSRPRHRPSRSQSAPPERRSPPAISQDSSAIATGRALKRSSTPTLLSRSITRGGELVRPAPPLCMSCHCRSSKFFQI